MLKTTSFVRFHKDGDQSELRERWIGEHARMVLALPGVVRYVQNLSRTTDGQTPPFDGYWALWWSDRSSYVQALQSPLWRRVQEDAAELVDTEWMERMSAEIDERVMRVGLGAPADGVSTPPPTTTKAVGVLRYLPTLRRDEANEYWVRTHGELALAIPEIGHYVHNHAARPLRGRAAPPGFDGYSEAWFTDDATHAQALATDGWKALAADGPNLFERSATIGAVVVEHVQRG